MGICGRLFWLILDQKELACEKRATPPVEPKVTGDVEARVIALTCSQPPAGRARWTLRLLERQVALAEGIPPMDHSTIGRVLKRGRLSLI
jgi:hypothetical protein